jgi:pilus assembly protein CpaF
VVEQSLGEYLSQAGLIISGKARRNVVKAVIDEIVGYGPIQDLLEDESVTEIMVNGPSRIYVEKAGKIVLSDKAFRNDQHVLRIIDKIVAALGRRVDESSPMVDARLPDGSRVNAVIPPLSLRGPTVTIRKFSKVPYTGEDIVRFGTITQDMLTFLECCVRARLNILISGGTGSGKTTTLNVLSALIPADERIITIEDAAELQLQQEHVVTLESRPMNLEGKGEVTIRQLVRNALRMRPNRIVVGEVRGGETLDMLQAMNTGHDGSLTTAHSNSPRDTISRLETMVMMAGTDLPVKAIREQVASAINIIVHQNRIRDGSRKVTHITELQGMEGEHILLQDIFIYAQEGIAEDGRVLGGHKFTGLRPRCLERFKQYGINYQLPAG